MKRLMHMRFSLSGIILLCCLCFAINGFSGDRTEDSLKISAFLSSDSDQYTTLKERRKFYKRADKLLTGYGYEVRWLNVAAKTVRVLELAHGKVTGFFARSNAEIRAFIRAGNKMILDDMLRYVRELWKDGVVLKGEDAMRWDAQMLSNEQDLIDASYEALSEKSKCILDKNLKGVLSRCLFGNPKFYGFITDQNERWSFGMRKMKYDVQPEMMPVPGNDWRTVKL